MQNDRKRIRSFKLIRISQLKQKRGLKSSDFRPIRINMRLFPLASVQIICEFARSQGFGFGGGSRSQSLHSTMYSAF